jgi:Leucine-rich repeat (LRR) protein
MQVDNAATSRATHPPLFAPPDNNAGDTLFTSLLPLQDYHRQFSIAAHSLPMPIVADNTVALSAELIEMVQSFCSTDDLLSLTSVDKTALATRFCNPPLQQLFFKTVADTEQFLAYCRASQDREAHDLSLEDTQKSRKRLKFKAPKTISSLSTLFSIERLQEIKRLTLTVSEQFTLEDYQLLFTYLPQINQLTIRIPTQNRSFLRPILPKPILPKQSSGFLLPSLPTTQTSHFLVPLFQAARHLTLHHLALIKLSSQPKTYHSRSPGSRSCFIHTHNNVEYHLLNELRRFTTLETLLLEGFNEISHIPEGIGQLTALKSLTLNNMRALNGLPANIVHLTKLETLILESSDITALPDEIGQLNQLKMLSLNDLGIAALPEGIGQLGNLETLIINNLPIIKLPNEIGQLNALKSLTLQSIYLQALPETIGQLKALQSLTIKNTSSLKTLPASVGKLDKLEVLILESSGLSAVPEEIGQLKALKSLTLGAYPSFIFSNPHQISQWPAGTIDELPISLWQLDKLEVLILNNLCIKAIPEEIGQLKSLKSLTLVGSNIKGCGAFRQAVDELPISLGQLDKLEVLSLERLSLKALPDEIGQLKALKSLKIDSMCIDSLPASLCQLNKLETLTLIDLDLRVLPDKIGQLDALKSLLVGAMHSLTTLPTTLGQLDKLEVLTLRRLVNIAALPEEMGQLHALKSLTLSWMDALKKLPASLGQLKKLEVLTLTGLKIEALPDEIGQLTTLKSLDLIHMDLLKAVPKNLRHIIKRSSPGSRLYLYTY